jgi:hypothetical protein
MPSTLATFYEVIKAVSPYITQSKNLLKFDFSKVNHPLRPTEVTEGSRRACGALVKAPLAAVSRPGKRISVSASFAPLR